MLVRVRVPWVSSDDTQHAPRNINPPHDSLGFRVVYIVKREDVKRDVTSLDYFYVLRFTNHAE